MNHLKITELGMLNIENNYIKKLRFGLPNIENSRYEISRESSRIKAHGAFHVHQFHERALKHISPFYDYFAECEIGV